MPDERDVAQDKKAMEQNEEQGTIAEVIGKNPEHQPQAGQKTPQKEKPDEDAINESGERIYDDGKDENDAK